MHELGHTLGFGHGGGDAVNYKPNYLSVMAYGLQMCGVPVGPVPADLPGGCDYSRDDLFDLVEPLPPGPDECQGFDAGLYGFGPADWDGDTIVEGVTNRQPPNNANVSADINGDSEFTTLLRVRRLGQHLLRLPHPGHLRRWRRRPRSG